MWYLFSVNRLQRTFYFENKLSLSQKDDSTDVDNPFCILWSAVKISILIYPHRLSKLYDQKITVRDRSRPIRTVSEQKLTQPMWITSLYYVGK